MSRYRADSDEQSRRIARALIVQEYGPDDVDALEYIAAATGWD